VRLRIVVRPWRDCFAQALIKRFLAAAQRFKSAAPTTKHKFVPLWPPKSPEDPLLTVLTVANPSTFLKERGAPPTRSKPHFPESHCSECGKAGGEDDPLIGVGDGYLRHRACISLLRELPQPEDAAKTAQSPAVTCWHCGKATYRPRRLAWGKDLIPLHEGCVGPWIDAWDAMLTARSSLEGVQSDSDAPDADQPERPEEGDTDASGAE
jgi:hypothetical protein